jgi:hypothetical protein
VSNDDDTCLRTPNDTNDPNGILHNSAELTVQITENSEVVRQPVKNGGGRIGDWSIKQAG